MITNWPPSAFLLEGSILTFVTRGCWRDTAIARGLSSWLPLPRFACSFGLRSHLHTGMRVRDMHQLCAQSTGPQCFLSLGQMMALRYPPNTDLAPRPRPPPTAVAPTLSVHPPVSSLSLPETWRAVSHSPPDSGSAAPGLLPSADLTPFAYLCPGGSFCCLVTVDKLCPLVMQ